MPQAIDIATFITASGGLGAAAMGVVDASKAFFGGPSRLGFGDIKAGLRPYLLAISHAADSAAPGRAVDDTIQTLRANWMNGVPLAEQKAKAKALVHLGITPSSAPALATLAGVDAGQLTGLASNVAAGEPPTPTQMNVLGQFDVVLSAVLDAAYERADQKYRNGCKLLATAVAVGMALSGRFVLPAELNGGVPGPTPLGVALLAGLLGTPLAPVSKDLVTKLQAFVAKK